MAEGTVVAAPTETRLIYDGDTGSLFVLWLKVLGLSLQEMGELEGIYQTERSNRTVLPRLIELLDAHLATVDGRISELHALRDEIRRYREHVATRLIGTDR